MVIWMKWTYIMIIGLLLAGCTAQGSRTDISPEQLQGMLESEDVYLVDTHIPEQQHIAGTDAFIPYNEVLANLDQIPKDKKVVVYCRSGSMSAEASEQLAAEGYEVYNLLGGTNAWRSRGYEFER